MATAPSDLPKVSSSRLMPSDSTSTKPALSAPAAAAPGSGTGSRAGKRMPRVGDMVWYWYGGDARRGDYPCPAIVLKVWDDGLHLELNVHRFHRLAAYRKVAHSPTPRIGCWTFPGEMGPEQK